MHYLEVITNNNMLLASVGQELSRAINEKFTFMATPLNWGS